MLIRIVKMKFKPETIDSFKVIFKNNKEKIRHFEGCLHLELYQDQNDSSLFFTYSYWESEQHLDTYRNSELFKSIWATTKVGFSEQPEAWSLNKLEELN